MKKQQHLQKSKVIIVRILSTTDEEYADCYCCYRRCYYSSTMCYWVHFGEVGQCGTDYGGNHCCCCCCCWLSELCTTDFYLSRKTEGPINDGRSNIRHQMDVLFSLFFFLLEIVLFVQHQPSLFLWNGSSDEYPVISSWQRGCFFPHELLLLLLA